MLYYADSLFAFNINEDTVLIYLFSYKGGDLGPIAFYHICSLFVFEKDFSFIHTLNMYELKNQLIG